ncbi:hypothetical protein [Duganella radicis]|uniref:Aerotolerance regulator N-terminal domain-containing protein n=1 Tax=Duganella radicis TaxID=551988 RepID=A0A6L6PKI2_9BURK|nr:hypothetical protein [Duganella radicis]MTV39484.1 hypothetical protein [Duganella radicis]
MILSSYPLWWLALPVLLLPVWWHRQKRQRIKAELLATAHFLPSAPPEQLRIWQWRDKVLLVVRCLMLVALIAWLAATIFPWRGDTVLVDAGVDKSWAEKEIAAAGFSAASRVGLPPNALQWLRANERDWRADARLLIIARANQLAMPARLPQYNHHLELRTQAVPLSASTPSAAPIERRVALAVPDTRAAAWRSLFAAFGSAGEGVAHYVLVPEPDAKATLIVWDTPNTAPPDSLRAPHWWIATAPATAQSVTAQSVTAQSATAQSATAQSATAQSATAPSAAAASPLPATFPELANAASLTINGITLKYADSPRGRLWTSEAFPPRDADTARALYEAWQLLAAAPAPAYPTPSQTFTAARNSLPAIGDAKPASWLALALLALFMIERILTHARRH